MYHMNMVICYPSGTTRGLVCLSGSVHVSVLLRCFLECICALIVFQKEFERVIYACSFVSVYWRRTEFIDVGKGMDARGFLFVGFGR